MVWPNYQDFYNPLIARPHFMSWDDLLLGATHDIGMNLFTNFQKKLPIFVAPILVILGGFQILSLGT
jgi:hypothetical protein